MKTILLIEDHDMMRLFLANYFGSDYEVKAVSDVDLALNWLKNHDADLILADFPADPNGSSIHRISHLSSHKNIPLIILTDQDKSEQRIRAFQWGAKDSISKPFNPAELKLRVNCHLPAFTQVGTFSTVA
ncbi:response regulator transcription factor [Algoriphagus namhaensis]|uniref:Response regulator transcription factor n=1 Tax=Algoriphagus namhaensis TaxID=915353 RepID=A0ABV8APQ0_9BACT